MLDFTGTLRTIAGQLGRFTRTARLLLGALMVILVMGLVLVATYAGRASLVPLGLRNNLTPEVKTRAVNFLDMRGIKWEEENGDLMVPGDERSGVLAQLTENEVITPEQIDFASIMQDDSPFTDRTTRKTRFLVVKMNEVARMISEFSGIERATVVIDQPDRAGGLGAPRIQPTASVSVLPKGDHLTGAQADAIARLVAGAHAELKVQNVTVIDARTGRAIIARAADDMPSTRYLETKLAHEQVAKQKIEEALSVFPGVVVAVNALVDATEETENSTTYGDPKSGLQEESTLERNSRLDRESGEAGVRPNTGANLSGGAKSVLTSDTRGSSKLVNAFDSSAKTTRDPKGYAVQINATVLVPESYILRLHRGPDGEEADPPDPATFDQLAMEVKTEIERLVTPLIDTGRLANAVPGTVVVSLFADVASGGFGGAGGGLAETAGFGTMLVSSGMARFVGLGALAAVSLLLMLMMVRKATREEELPSAAELVGIPPALTDADTAVVGEAGETVAAMEGVEIDEGSVRRQQMVDQINDLAVNAADEAASLLRKWIKTDD
jgi:flagellar M-ring protein FliF